MKPKLLYYQILNFQPKVLYRMNDLFEIIELPDPASDTSDILSQVEICIAPLGYTFGKEKINRCKRLRIIASSTLSVPHIDTEYCRQKGIQVYHLGNEKYFLETITPTAELTMGLIIALTRRILWAHQYVCDGRWGGKSFGMQTPKMISDMNLGIIGLGRLGTMVAEYGKAFGMKIGYYSPRARDSRFQRFDSLQELAGAVDIVSLHAHLTDETEKMIDASFFSAMCIGSFFINTARGAIVDQDALLKYLQNRHLGGAAIDVLAEEYDPDFLSILPGHPLVEYARKNDNLIITPHYAGATMDAWVATQEKTIDLIMASLETNIREESNEF